MKTKMKAFRELCGLLLLSPVLASPQYRRPNAWSNDITWGTTKIRGVNIGGWLVLEPWITPSIFESLDQSLNVIDEYTLCERLPEQAPSILQEHWESWTSFEDFQKIASAGFNLVRIPIGYWAFDNSNSPYIMGADAYLEKAIEWARHTSPPLNVMIDLHGAPGSQNGYDNSGQRTQTPTWLTDGIWGATTMQTLGVIEMIASKYAAKQYEDVVVAIELINEPQGWRLNRNDLAQFFREGFGRVRNHNHDTKVVISDAFDSSSSWNGILTPQENNAHNVAIDHHYYQVFSPSEVAMTAQQHIDLVCTTANSYWHADKWTFIGEWTGALTDCARYLNGYGVGVRYEGTWPSANAPQSSYIGSCKDRHHVGSWNEQTRQDTRRFIEAQLDAFEANTQGWVWWNFKTEMAHEWDMFALLDAGIFPQPLTDRRFAPACTSYS